MYVVLVQTTHIDGTNMVTIISSTAVRNAVVSFK